MTIGSRLKMIRKSRNLKLIEVGKIFDITAQTLSRYENDQRTPDNEFLEDFGRHFKLSGNWLLYNEPPIYRKDEQDRDIKESFIEFSNLISSKEVPDIDIPVKPDLNKKITDDIPENYLLLIKYMLKYPIIRKSIFQFFYLLLKPLIDKHPELSE
ncbi:MAG: helix-turn-helix transcriptional regulator [Candidatus Aminicenantes bacterium]|nr:MAG: helix-turn-helix transcriptional regulator [Candidatus Aminicenantes bacterium]